MPPHEQAGVGRAGARCISQKPREGEDQNGGGRSDETKASNENGTAGLCRPSRAPDQ
jgi:hypothetical protein